MVRGWRPVRGTLPRIRDTLQDTAWAVSGPGTHLALRTPVSAPPSRPGSQLWASVEWTPLSWSGGPPKPTRRLWLLEPLRARRAGGSSLDVEYVNHLCLANSRGVWAVLAQTEWVSAGAGAGGPEAAFRTMGLQEAGPAAEHRACKRETVSSKPSTARGRAIVKFSASLSNQLINNQSGQGDITAVCITDFDA